MTTRNEHGAYTPSYPQPVVDLILRLAIRGDKYEEIAAAVRSEFKLRRFSKNNVAGMVSRLREKGRLEKSRRCGGHRSPRHSTFDRRPPAPITLVKV